MISPEATTEEAPRRNRLHMPGRCGHHDVPATVLMHRVHASWHPDFGWTLYAPAVLHDGGAEAVRFRVATCPWCGETLA